MMIVVYSVSFLGLLAMNLFKKKEFFKYGLFRRKGFTDLKKTILTYGYNYSFKTHILVICFFVGMLAFMCFVFEVRIETFVFFAFLILLIFPHILIWLLFHSYQERLFNQFTMFLQNFIAIYKLHPKTYPTLCECEKVCEGEILNLIQKMKNSLLEQGSIEACMQILTDFQPHFIVHNLATLICTIENHGGSYGEGLDLIQDDIDDWIEDIYIFKKQQNGTKNKMMGLCFMSLGIAYIAKSMLSQIHFNTQGDIYQMSIFLFLACLMFTILMAHRIFSKSWFEKEEML